MDIQAFQTEYQDKHDSFQLLAETARLLLFRELSKEDIKIHSIPFRVKSINSSIDKIRRKSFRNPFTEMKDLAGIRVVCLFLSDIQRVAAVAKSTFEILEEDNKIEDSPENFFGYIDHKLTAKLKSESLKTLSTQLLDFHFEIQIKTITQDAWASISHILDYKQHSQIPQHLRRGFFALHGLFYVADTQFDIISKNRTLE